MSTTTQDVAIQTYIVDPAHSRLGFVVRHLGFSKVRGAFEQFEGTVRMAPGDLSTLEAEATVQTQSITTNEEKRDAHLRSADFFEVDAYPTITFKSTEVRDVNGNRFTLVGDLTMHGVTKRVALEGEFLGEGPDPWGGTRVAFEAGTTINRKDFGLNWNVALETGGWLVSEDVEIVIEVQAVLQQGEAA
ncbi:MAG TPA: YceI family protein [Rubricoccaceae bacterium]|nr:YceI family protein [Rubricoccaceae bacterium]